MDINALKDFIAVGRITAEDEEKVVLEVPKSLDYKFDLDANNPDKNKFLTLIFIRNYEGSIEPVMPDKIT